MSINHAALRFISPQLHSRAQLVSLFSKCGSRVHASRRLHGRARVTLTPTELSQAGLRMNSVGVLSEKINSDANRCARHNVPSIFPLIVARRTSRWFPTNCHQRCIKTSSEGRRRHAISMTRPTADARWLTKNCCRCLKFVTFPTLRLSGFCV